LFAFIQKKGEGLFISSGDILLSIISPAKFFAMAVASVLVSKKASNARSEESERQRVKGLMGAKL
jgi:hypothetical protein